MTTQCHIATVPGLHPALAARFSPVLFDPDAVLTSDQVDTLLEAARRAPSAGNSQPWMFIVGRRGDAVHDRLVAHLARSSGSWAPAASLLIANVAHAWVEGTTDWEYSDFSQYDLIWLGGLSRGQGEAASRTVVVDAASVDRWRALLMRSVSVSTRRQSDMRGLVTAGRAVRLERTAV